MRQMGALGAAVAILAATGEASAAIGAGVCMLRQLYALEEKADQELRRLEALADKARVGLLYMHWGRLACRVLE